MPLNRKQPMPPVDPRDKPIDIVARPVNPDGTLGEPEPDPSAGPEFLHLAVPGRRPDDGPHREEVRYWRFETGNENGCGCSGCGCLTVIVMLAVLFLLRTCGL